MPPISLNDILVLLEQASKDPGCFLWMINPLGLIGNGIGICR
ncbi:hypothetical protein [Gordonia sihwensis]|nr:hypothetical protein [Gordonia sihwensis]